MLSEGVCLHQSQLVAIEILSCDAELPMFGKPYRVMGADSWHDHVADTIGPQLAVQAWPDRFGCEFDYDQILHRCAAVYRSCDCVFQFPAGMQQIGHRAIMELVSSNKDRETN